MSISTDVFKLQNKKTQKTDTPVYLMDYSYLVNYISII